MFFMEPPRDIYGGNGRFKQLWRRSERLKSMVLPQNSILAGTSGLLYFNAVIPESSRMIVVSSCSVFGVAQLLLTKAGDATTMQKAATAARLMVIFLIFSLFVFILFFFSSPSEVTIFGRGEVGTFFKYREKVFSRGIIQFIAYLFH